MLEQLESHRRRIQELEEQASKHIELKTKCQDLLNVTGRLWAQLNSNIIMLADRATCFLPDRRQGQLDSAGHSNGPVKTGGLVFAAGTEVPSLQWCMLAAVNAAGSERFWSACCQLGHMLMPVQSHSRRWELTYSHAVWCRGSGHRRSSSISCRVQAGCHGPFPGQVS